LSDNTVRRSRVLPGNCLRAFQSETALNELEKIENALDEESDFFREYSPKQLDKRIKLENALDAQFDKLTARLINLREARILRDKSGRSAPGVDEASKSLGLPSRQGGQEFDLAELDRDDVDKDADDAVDPLVEFLAADPLQDGEEAANRPEVDADDADDWGEPKDPGVEP
jgi:hypothetical protein